MNYQYWLNLYHASLSSGMTPDEAGELTALIIRQSNARARAAIVSARIDHNAETVTEVRDALNFRRSSRDRHLPKAEKEELNEKAARTYMR